MENFTKYTTEKFDNYLNLRFEESLVNDAFSFRVWRLVQRKFFLGQLWKLR